jgi:HSP20 family protein
MLATRGQPFGALWGDMDRFRREMDRLFGRHGIAEAPEFTPTYLPVNVWEDEEKLYVEAELPGLKLEDLTIEITEGNVLTIQGERKPAEAPKGVWHRQERGFGKFARALELPYPVEAAKVEAKFENGVLFVALPRAEAAKPRRIAVKGG